MTEAVNSTKNGVQVLGLCRFSVPSAGAFQVEHDTIEARRAYLYDPARLALRFTWFENVTLPGVAAQKDPDFKLIVLMGEDFPEPWRGRMLAHVERVPQLVAEFAPPKHHRKICADAIARHIDPEADAVLQFRLDDDDAIAVNFTRRLRRDFRKSRGIFKAHGRMAIDYSRGINLVDTGTDLEIIPRFEVFLGVAFAIATKPGDGQSILDFPHHVIWRRMPAVTQPDAIMWVRGGHGTNDSGDIGASGQYEAEAPALRQVLRKQFRIDLQAFKTALGSIHAATEDPGT